MSFLDVARRWARDQAGGDPHGAQRTDASSRTGPTADILERAEAESLRRCYHQRLDDSERTRLAGEPAAGDQLAQLVLQAVACTPDPAAWRLYSRRLDRELWLARDAGAATALDADGARAGLPVVLADDLERLRDFDDRRLNDLLDVLIYFPGARIAELDPEAAS
jgi:hypothetical protein